MVTDHEKWFPSLQWGRLDVDYFVIVLKYHPIDLEICDGSMAMQETIVVRSSCSWKKPV